MPPVIENPDDCEIRSVIRYLSAKGVKVYGQNIISDGMVRNYHVFLHLKNHLGGQRHDDDDSVKTTVLQWLSHQAENFYDEGIKKPCLI